jgi:hypothetical protein
MTRISLSGAGRFLKLLRFLKLRWHELQINLHELQAWKFWKSVDGLIAMLLNFCIACGTFSSFRNSFVSFTSEKKSDKLALSSLIRKQQALEGRGIKVSKSPVVKGLLLRFLGPSSYSLDWAAQKASESRYQDIWSLVDFLI